MELLKNIRAYEDVFFEDPEENPDTPRFRVWFDDKHIEEYLAKVGNAIDRAQANEQMAREADTPEKAAEANAAQARLMKRTISAFIGTEGWEQLMARGLAYSERADQVQALNRAQRRAKAKRKKKGGK